VLTADPRGRSARNAARTRRRRRVQLRARGPDGSAAQRRGDLRDTGELAFKPRDQWHSFWSAGDEPCRILEIISPAGFEHFFREWDAGTKDGTLDPEELSGRFGIEFDMDSVPRLFAEHGRVHPLLG